MNSLWINKYKPKNLDEIIGNKNQIKKIEEWLQNINNLKSMSMIVSGGHGIGKSLTLKYLFEKYNYFVKIIYPNEIKNYRNFDDFKDFFNYKNSVIADFSKRVGDKACVTLKGLAGLYFKGMPAGFAGLLLRPFLIVAHHA